MARSNRNNKNRSQDDTNTDSEPNQGYTTDQDIADDFGTTGGLGGGTRRDDRQKQISDAELGYGDFDDLEEM